MGPDMIAGDLAFLIEQDGILGVGLVGGSYKIAQFDITTPAGKKYLVQVSELEEI